MQQDLKIRRSLKTYCGVVLPSTGYSRENSDRNILEGETGTETHTQRVGGVHMCAQRNQRLTLGAFLRCYRYYYSYYYSLLLLLFAMRSLTDWLGWLASELQKPVCLCSIELTAQAYAAMPAFQMGAWDHNSGT